MPAGGKGDEPYLDIVGYGIRVFSEKADNLIRDLGVLMDLQESLDFRSELMKIVISQDLDIRALETQLEQKKTDLMTRAEQNGLDLELLESEMLRRRQGKV